MPSFVAGLRRLAFPATVQEHDVASLLAHHEAELDVAVNEAARSRPEVHRGYHFGDGN